MLKTKNRANNPKVLSHIIISILIFYTFRPVFHFMSKKNPIFVLRKKGDTKMKRSLKLLLIGLNNK